MNFELDVDVPSDWPWRIRNSNRVVTSGLPPMCVVDFELEKQLDVGVASDCPWIAAFAVTAYASGLPLIYMVFGELWILIRVIIGCKTV